MSDYTLVVDGKDFCDLSNVSIDETNAVVSFSAPFMKAPAGTCVIRRNADNKTVGVVINNFNMNNGVITWSAMALVRPG
jgi:hypothetical protein